MKSIFKNIATELGYLNEQESSDRDKSKDTTSGEFNVDVPVQNEMEKVNIKYGHVTGPVDDVTISWGDESHTVDFKETSPLEVVDDHENEGKDVAFYAYSEDDKWEFSVVVSVDANYENSGEIYEVQWNTLEIDINDAKVNEQEDPRRPKDIEFDDAQAMSKLTPDDRDKVGKIQQMMSKEKETKNFTDNLEKEIKEKFGEYGSVSERKPGIYRVKFSYMRREFEDKVWNEMLKFIEDKGFEIDEDLTDNYYEPNYDREEPAEAVPMIHFSTSEQDDFESGFKAESLQEIFKRRAGII